MLWHLYVLGILALTCIDCSSPRQINDKMLSLETKIDGYKKSITQEEEQNERLTLHLNQAQADCSTSHKLITHSQNHQEVLQAQYSNYTHMLQETEKTLGTLRMVLYLRRLITQFVMCLLFIADLLVKLCPSQAQQDSGNMHFSSSQ